MYTPGTKANLQTERLQTKTKMVLLRKYKRVLAELGILKGI